jgi:hypothetical protein
VPATAKERVEMKVRVMISRDVEGVEMGVFADGTTYLTESGLASLCGVSRSSIQKQRDAWRLGSRDNPLQRRLVEEGYDDKELFVAVSHRGSDANAYPEPVCRAVLHYYALDVPNPSAQSKASLSRLTQAGLRLFVYRSVGYDPGRQVPEIWKEFHDRMLLESSPVGYFSVFKELADFTMAAIRGGLACDERTIPDISIGKTWGNHWVENGLEGKYGSRIPHEHNYPDYFPQARSNPQEIWVYPEAAIPAFRTWMRNAYFPQKFPRYLSEQVKKGSLHPAAAEALLKALPESPKRSG